MKLFDRSTKAGFTLVELIVVIAILAILAGIAIPVYNGYIKKANKAGDLQLLDAVNTAFAAACIENGVNPKGLSDATLTVTDKKISGVSVTGAETALLSARANDGIVYSNLGFNGGVQYAQLAASSEDVSASFLKYFGTNKDTELKFYDSSDDFVFNPETGVFEPADGSGTGGASVTYTFFGSTVTLSQSDIDNLNASIFGEMGAAELTGSVSKVTDVAADLFALGKGQAYLTNAGFVEFMSGILPEGTSIDDLNETQKANALVLYAANQTSGKTGDDYVTAFTTNKGQTMLKLMQNKPEALADAAAAYATMMAFANSEYGEKYMVGSQTVKEYFDSQTSQLQHMSNIATMFNTIDNATLVEGGDSGLLSYTKNYAGTQLDGYISALNMVNSNLGNIDSDDIVSLLNNGFGSEDVMGLLRQVIGD